MEFLKGILLTAVIFFPLERVLSMHPGQKMLRRAWFNDLVYWIVNGQIIGLSLAALVSGVVLASGWLLGPTVHEAVAAQPYWLQFIEALILSDIGFYFTHRAFHAFPSLWRFHAVHHSIEELDWLAAARVHPIDQIITKGVSLLPVFALGFSDAVIAAYMTLYAWQSVFIHSNVNIKFGPLRWILASPEFHHWHHSKDVETRDRNFAGQLPFLDVLFGTLHMPPGQLPKSYGIDAPMPQNYLLQLAYPFRAAADPVNQDEGTIVESAPIALPDATTPRSSRQGA
jgi:sterol desaturase/sphingolipid hydroxylase (fatty acid hydroxylase superfamily)